MVASTTADGITAYTWISKNHIENLQPLEPNQAHSLYKVTYQPSSTDNDSVPSTSIVKEDFWLQGEWGYGQYGNVVMNGTAYLYARNQNKTAVALAKVTVDQIEDRSQYQYYVGGKWTMDMPSLTDGAAFINNFETALQGTFYYSEAFGSYIWIGQNGRETGAGRALDRSLCHLYWREQQWPYRSILVAGKSRLAVEFSGESDLPHLDTTVQSQDVLRICYAAIVSGIRIIIV